MSEVFRVNKIKNFTVMANHHLRNTKLSLRAKGLLSLMLRLPDSWDYSLAGFSKISKEGTSAISSALKELEQEGYLMRQRMRNSKGHLIGTEYIIYEKPIADSQSGENPKSGTPKSAKPKMANHLQSSTNTLNTKESNTYPSITAIDAIGHYRIN